MHAFIQKLKSIPKPLILAAALIAVGLVIMIPKGKALLELSKEAHYAIENNFESGNPSLDLLRPWMTLRYIASNYAVPQKYLFEACGIPARKESSEISISRLNNIMRLGDQDGMPALLFKIRAAIQQYRDHPVVTGLLERHAEDWMTVEYIASSTGIPAETLLSEINLPVEGNRYVPLGPLSDRLKYTGGVQGLEAALQKVIDSHPVQP